MSNIYAFIVCHLRTHPLRKSQNRFAFSVSLRTVILVSIDSTSRKCLDVTDSVPGFTAIWEYSHKLKNFSKSKKYIRMGFLVLKDHKCLLLL